SRNNLVGHADGAPENTRGPRGYGLHGGPVSLESRCTLRVQDQYSLTTIHVSSAFAPRRRWVDFWTGPSGGARAPSHPGPRLRIRGPLFRCPPARENVDRLGSAVHHEVDVVARPAH